MKLIINADNLSGKEKFKKKRKWHFEKKNSFTGTVHGIMSLITTIIIIGSQKFPPILIKILNSCHTLFTKKLASFKTIICLLNPQEKQEKQTEIE